MVEREPMKAPERLGTVDDAAQYLAVSSDTIRRMIAAGKVTAYRVGPRVIRIDMDALFDSVARPMGMNAA